MREHNISDIDPVDLGPAWEAIIRYREVTETLTCEFGFAEEVIVLMRFADDSFEVGVGEALRPYRQLYAGGFSEVEAVKAFYEEVARLATIGCD